MELEYEDKTIDGVDFRVAPVPATLGRKTLARLLRSIAPSMAGLFEGKSVDLEKITETEVNLSGAIERIGAALTEDNIDYLCDLFQDYCQVRIQAGQPYLPLKGSFDDVFTQKYGLLMKWLYANLEVNFRGFFGGHGLSTAAALFRSAVMESSKSDEAPSSPQK